jgi:arabinose-5-phosphate isomerase
MAKDIGPFTVDRTDSIREAMVKITANRIRAVVVLDEGKVVGTVSDGDIRRAFLKDVMPISPVEQIMNLNCVTTTEADPQRWREIVRRHRVTLLPIVDRHNVLLDVFLAYEPSFEQGAS